MVETSKTRQDLFRTGGGSDQGIQEAKAYGGNTGFITSHPEGSQKSRDEETREKTDKAALFQNARQQAAMNYAAAQQQASVASRSFTKEFNAYTAYSTETPQTEFAEKLFKKADGTVVDELGETVEKEWQVDENDQPIDLETLQSYEEYQNLQSAASTGYDKNEAAQEELKKAETSLRTTSAQSKDSGDIQPSSDNLKEGATPLFNTAAIGSTPENTPKVTQVMDPNEPVPVANSAQYTLSA